MARTSANAPYFLFVKCRAIALNTSCISAVPVLWCVATTRTSDAADAEPEPPFFFSMKNSVFIFGAVVAKAAVSPRTNARRSSAASLATSITFEDVRSASAAR